MRWLRQDFIRVARTICFSEIAIFIAIHCFHSLQQSNEEWEVHFFENQKTLSNGPHRKR